jgi:osmotically-inducible protein OsmY
MKKLIGVAAAIGALTYFFDPQLGRTRRAELRQRVPAFFRRRGREAERLARAASSEAYGLKQKATHVREEPKEQPNDETLAAKVETELFRDADVPKGQININAQDGVVQLRGEVPDEDMIDDLVEKARSVQGVLDVENLLHTPGQPAPMHQ